MFIIAMLALMTLVFDASASVAHLEYWSCMQIGQQNKHTVLVLSDLQTAHYSHEKHLVREKAFAEFVKKNIKIVNEYQPLCQDFYNKKEANLIRTHIVKRAEKNGSLIIPVKFPFGEKGG